MFAQTDWPATLGLIAGTIIALYVIVTKGILPAARAIAGAEKSVPLVRDLTEQLKDIPDSFKILKEIISQFRSNSGSTLKDAVDRIEEAAAAQAKMIARIEAAVDNETAVNKTIQVNQESLRQLQEQDRTAIAALTAVINELLAKANLAELGAALLALNLETHHEAEREGRSIIADDLEASHQRAEATPESDAGAAADAAMRREPDANG